MNKEDKGAAWGPDGWCGSGRLEARMARTVTQGNVAARPGVRELRSQILECVSNILFILGNVNSMFQIIFFHFFLSQNICFVSHEVKKLENPGMWNPAWGKRPLRSELVPSRVNRVRALPWHKLGSRGRRRGQGWQALEGRRGGGCAVPAAASDPSRWPPLASGVVPVRSFLPWAVLVGPQGFNTHGAFGSQLADQTKDKRGNQINMEEKTVFKGRCCGLGHSHTVSTRWEVSLCSQLFPKKCWAFL